MSAEQSPIIYETRIINYNTYKTQHSINIPISSRHKSLSNISVLSMDIESKDNECVICFNTVNEFLLDIIGPVSEIQYTRNLFYYNLKNQKCSCKYDIHFECLINWLLTKSQCPMCRNPVDINKEDSTITINNIYEGIVIIRDSESELIIDLNNCEYFDSTQTLNPSQRIVIEEHVVEPNQQIHPRVQFNNNAITYILVITLFIIFLFIGVYMMNTS
jgi:hypothetical protein